MQSTFLAINSLVFIFVNIFNISVLKVENFFYTTLVFFFSMSFLLISDNVFLFFIFWEMLSICSYILIAQTDEKSAQEAFLFNLFGGVCLFAGLVIHPDVLTGLDFMGFSDKLHVFIGNIPSVELIQSANVTISNFLNFNEIKAGFIPLGEHFKKIGEVFISIGVLAKSAQFLFSRWLIGSMKASPQTSAYLHSATLVKAGVFLTLKITKNLTLFNDIVLISSIFTITKCVYDLCFKSSDLKEVLAQFTIMSISTCLVYSILGSRYGLENLAIKYIFIHAVYKSSMFLSLSCIEQKCGTKKISEIKNAFFKAPFASIIFILGFFISISSPGSEILYKNNSWIAFLSSAMVLLSKVFMIFYSGYIIDKVFLNKMDKTDLKFDFKSILIFPLVCFSFYYFKSFSLKYLTVLAFILFVALFRRFFPGVFNKQIYKIINVLVVFISSVMVFKKFTFTDVSFFQINFFLMIYIIYVLCLINRDFISGFLKQLYSIVFEKYKSYYLHAHNNVNLHTILLFSFLTASGIVFLIFSQDVLRAMTFELTSSVEKPLLIMLMVATFNLYGIYKVYTCETKFDLLLGLNIIGLSVGYIYIYCGAVDVAIVHFLSEAIGTVFVYKLIKTKKNYESKKIIPGFIISVVVFMLLVYLYFLDFDTKMIEYFQEITSHSNNIVNMIVTDYRGFDTWGEMIVVSIVAITIYYIKDGVDTYRKNTSVALKKGLIDSIKSTYPEHTHETIMSNINFSENNILRREEDIFIKSISRLMIQVLSIYGIISLFQGHNIPGGGFAAGLIGSIFIVKRYINFKPNLLKVILIGILFSFLSVMFPKVLGYEFFTNLSFYELSTALVFDICICFAVISLAKSVEI